MINLDNFLQGQRLNVNTQKEEQGFYTQGNIQAILNSDKKFLNSVHNGIVINATNKTNPEALFGILPSAKYAGVKLHDNLPDAVWEVTGDIQIDTPIIKDTEITLSHLLPQYPSGAANLVLGSNCNLQLNNRPSPTLYGVSTFGTNNSKVLTDACNDIGYELDEYGIANNNGMRALGQKNYSQQLLKNGTNVPNLYTSQNKHGVYYTQPGTFNENVPLYQTGNWTCGDNCHPPSSPSPRNFLNNFHDYLTPTGC